MNKPWNRGFGSNGFSRKALEPRVRIQRVLEKALEPRVRVQRVLEENTGTAVRFRFRPEPVCFTALQQLYEDEALVHLQQLLLLEEAIPGHQ